MRDRIKAEDKKYKFISPIACIRNISVHLKINL